MTQTQHRTDQNLKDSITTELAWTPNVDSTKIGVAVSDGAVTLSGEVSSYPEKMNAQHAVMRVRGVVAVAEEITVRSPWADAHDADIAREAVEALARSVEVPPNMVQVVVSGHFVTLSGNVRWAFQREAAARAVHALKGVTGVSNVITIEPDVSPRDIKATIGAAILRDAQLDAAGTTVTADRGVVTLEGTVRTWAERRQADEIAYSAPGVTTVINHLKVTR